jgi:hypothetical protein
MRKYCALRVDLSTKEISPVEIESPASIRKMFSSDVLGRTVRQLGGDLYLREWTSEKDAFSLVDCYDGRTLDLANLPSSVLDDFSVKVTT